MVWAELNFLEIGLIATASLSCIFSFIMILTYILNYEQTYREVYILIITLGISDFFFSFSFLFSLFSETVQNSTFCTIQGVMQQFSFSMGSFVILLFSLFFYSLIQQVSHLSIEKIVLGLLGSFLVSGSVSLYFITAEKIAKEGFWCFMSQTDAFYETLILVNGLYFICLVITIVLNFKIVNYFLAKNQRNKKLMNFRYLPFLQILYFPLIFYSTALKFMNQSDLIQGITIGAIISNLNGVLNGIFYGLNIITIKKQKNKEPLLIA